MKRLNLNISIATFLFLCLSCFNPSNNEIKEDRNNSDSLEITNLLKEVYKWYSLNESQIYFDIIVKDSFQIGMDTHKLKISINRLKSTNFFSSDFIRNYEKIGLAADSILRNGKYYNEINFNFQDADIWTHSQGDEGDLWERIKVTDLKINGDYASLKWYDDNKDNNFLVKMKKENGFWKISYLDGLDSKNAI